MVHNAAEKRYTCETCNQKYYRRSDLLKHQETHSNIRPYKCGECSLTFKTRGVLVGHMKVHGPKKYECPECGHKFNRKGSLNLHMKTHNANSDDQSVNCSVCGKKLKSKRNLQLHMRIHTEDKPYSCSLCSKQFNQGHHLKWHQQKYHGMNPSNNFTCGVCKKHLRSDGRVLIGDFRTLYNHVIFDHRQCPLFIFPNDHDGPVIYRYSKNSHLWTLDQCKFWTFHFPPLKPMYCRKA